MRRRRACRRRRRGAMRRLAAHALLDGLRRRGAQREGAARTSGRGRTVAPMRMVSGPQGPRVVLDGRPVLLLCSDNHLGPADHPRGREGAADAAMRWGVGAGAPRLASGTMTLHRRLEERLADFLGTETALLFGSGYLASLGIVPALAERGSIVFCHGLGQPAVLDGCRLAGAEPFLYDHGDLEHLAWGLRHSDGRAALIVTDGVSAVDGERAPLEAVGALPRRRDAPPIAG